MIGVLADNRISKLPVVLLMLILRIRYLRSSNPRVKAHLIGSLSIYDFNKLLSYN